MYKKIVIATVTLLLLASGCISSDKLAGETPKESGAESGAIPKIPENSPAVNQSINQSAKTIEPPKPAPIIVPPPHTASEIVYQDQANGNYLLLNTTEHTYFVNQTGRKADSFGGTYSETSQTYNLNEDFGTTSVCVKGDNYITFEGAKGKTGVWVRV